MDVQKYKILYKEGEAEISEKKSRFIANAYNVESQDSIFIKRPNAHEYINK